MLRTRIITKAANKAQAKGVELNALINDLHKKDIDLIEGFRISLT